jgi:hypothetical protein
MHGLHHNQLGLNAPPRLQALHGSLDFADGPLAVHIGRAVLQQPALIDLLACSYQVLCDLEDLTVSGIRIPLAFDIRLFDSGGL